MSYDVIVVGSGAAGMTTALILAKEGKKVVVLEQNKNYGGLMRTFRRGENVYPTGIHCLGSLGKGQILRRYFSYLGVLDKLELVPMSGEGFEEYIFPGKKFRISCGHEAFKSCLLDYFPDEETAIDVFIKDLKRTVSGFSLYNLHREAEKPFEEEHLRPLQSYLDSITESRELKSVLSAINPLYGIKPLECPRYAHFLVLDSFLNSSWRVNEYSTPLSEAFKEALDDNGVEMRCGALVEEIICSSGVVKGAKLPNEEFIEAKTVVFTGHPRSLVELCRDSALRPAFRTRLSESPDTHGVFGLAVEWRNSDCPVASRDTFIYNSWDTNDFYNQNLITDGGLPQMLYCAGSPEVRKGAYSVVALCCLPSNEMAQWRDTGRKNRPQSYELAKRSIAERVFTLMKRTWPEAAGGMKIADSFTPLTFRDYTLTPEGSAYGLKKSVGAFRMAKVTAATRVKGLLLAGQSVVLPGMLGTVISSIDACTVILGHKYMVDRILKETE